MQVKNRETGELATFDIGLGKKELVIHRNGKIIMMTDSLQVLAENWEVA